MQFGRRRVHRGAAIQIERIFNLTDNSISGKKYPIILPSRFHTSLRPVPLDETGLPLSRTRRRSPRTNRLHYFSFPVPSLYRKINGITVCFSLANRSNPGLRCRSLSKFVAPRPFASRVAATVTTRLALRTRRRKYLVARWIASLRSPWTESAGGDRADAGGPLYPI